MRRRVRLELLTNMACMPMAPGQSLPQIWPLVSSHFERLLQHVAAGGGAAEQRFIERLVVNALRLCIRLIGWERWGGSVGTRNKQYLLTFDVLPEIGATG